MLKLRQQNYYYNIDILKCKDFITNSENMKTFLYQSMTNITRKRYVDVIAGFQYILNGVFLVLSFSVIWYPPRALQGVDRVENL